MRVPVTELERTAYHEAGHGVIAYRFRHYGGRLTVKPHDDLLGSAITEGESPDLASYKEQVCVLFAGFAAERHRDPFADPSGSEQDEEHAARLLSCLYDGAEVELRIHTDELVVEHWRAIEAVATALIEDTTLSGDEWATIVDALDDGDDWRSPLARIRWCNTQFRQQCDPAHRGRPKRACRPLRLRRENER